MMVQDLRDIRHMPQRWNDSSEVVEIPYLKCRHLRSGPTESLEFSAKNFRKYAILVRAAQFIKKSTHIVIPLKILFIYIEAMI